MGTKSITKLLTMLALIATMIACESYDGVLEVNQEALLKGKKGQIQMTEGVHPATLKVLSSKKLKLIAIVDGVKQETTIKLKNKLKIPAHTGEFLITAENSGLSMDLKGSVNTDVIVGNEIRDTEHCTMHKTLTKCDTICEVKEVIIKDENGRDRKVKRRICDDVCRRVTVSIPGIQKVKYFYKTHQELIDLIAQDQASGEMIAAFKGDYSNTHKNYTFRSLCMKR